MKCVLPIALALFAGVVYGISSTPSSQCDGSAFTTTATFSTDKYCRNSTNASCWTPHVPTEADSVLVPAGAVLTFESATNWTNYTYEITTWKNLMIEDGAQLVMKGKALQITECLTAKGDIKMSEPGQNEGPKTNTFLADSYQPEGTDCKLVPAGFTPRICGPGLLHQVGSSNLTVGSGYTSLFITTIVDASASVAIASGAYLWSNLTNYGKFTSDGYSYTHGFVYNYGKASVSSLVSDKWATKFVESPPIMFENHGEITFTDELRTTNAFYPNPPYDTDSSNWGGTYKAAVVNYGYVYYKYGGGATHGFDIFNFGTVEWGKNTEWGMGSWTGQGSYVNHGIFLTNGYSVFLANYFSVGGTLEVKKEGSFTMGNGAVDPKSIKLCTMSPVQVRAVRAAETRRAHNPLTVTQRDGCWWYGDFCYQTPYTAEAPPQLIIPKSVALPNQDELRAGGHGLTHGVAIALQKVISQINVPSACTERYSFSRNSKIIGDGTGSVVTTLPVSVSGTLDITNGGKWYAMIENHAPPTFGGGKVRIRPSGEVYLGIEADLSAKGKIQVDKGGLLAIPKHARVHISNHTVDVRHGGIFHVDGLLTTGDEAVQVNHCGRLQGKGKITKSKDEDMTCQRL